MTSEYGKGQYCPPTGSALLESSKKEAKGEVPAPRRPVARARQEPKLGRARGGVARLARRRGAAQGQVREVRRARQRGREGDRLRRRRRDVARGLRHAARRLRGGHRAPVGRRQAALRRAPLLRARASSGRVRQGHGARTRAHPRAAPRQHVGAGMEQHLRPRRAVPERAVARRRQARSIASTGTPSKMVKQGEHFFTALGFDAAAADVLGALAASPARAIAKSSATRARGTSPGAATSA